MRKKVVAGSAINWNRAKKNRGTEPAFPHKKTDQDGFGSQPALPGRRLSPQEIADLIGKTHSLGNTILNSVEQIKPGQGNSVADNPDDD